MGTENGIDFGSGVFILNNHGQMVSCKVIDFTDVTTTIDDDPPECSHYIPDSWFRDEICGTFNMSRTHFKAFQRIAWRWNAKGPIRKITILRLWEKRRER